MYWEDGRTDRSLGDNFGWLIDENDPDTAVGLVDGEDAFVYGKNKSGVDVIVAMKKVSSLDSGRLWIEEVVAKTNLVDIDTTSHEWFFDTKYYAWRKR